MQRAAQPRAQVVPRGRAEFAQHERQHQARRAVGVHRVAPVPLQQQPLEALGHLARIGRVGLVAESLAVQQAVPLQQFLGVEAARLPGIEVGAVRRAVGDAGDRIDDHAGCDVVGVPQHRQHGFIEAVRRAAGGLAPVRGGDAEAELDAARRVPGTVAADAAAPPGSVGRGQQHGHVQAVELPDPSESAHARPRPPAAAPRRPAPAMRRARAAAGQAATSRLTAAAAGQALTNERECTLRLPLQSAVTVASCRRSDNHEGLRQRSRHGRADAHAEGAETRHRLLRAVPEAGTPESGGFHQGPDRRDHDRGSGAARRPEARRHDRRGDRRQHRTRARAGGGAEGLSRGPRAPRQDEPGEDLQPAGDGRGGRADPLGRREGPPGVLPGRRRADRARERLVLTSTSSRIPTTRRRMP